MRSFTLKPERPKRSRKRAPEGFSDETVAAIWKRDFGLCAWCGLQITGTRGIDWSAHHRCPRSSGGTSRLWVNEAANGVLLHGHGTTGCHGDVEKNRQRALSLGFLVSANGRGTAVDIPLDHKVHGPCHLTNDGRAVGITRPLMLELLVAFGQLRYGLEAVN